MDDPYMAWQFRMVLAYASQPEPEQADPFEATRARGAELMAQHG